MIRITNRDLDKSNFTEAIKKLNDCSGLSGQQAYWIMRLTKECDKNVAKMREAFRTIMEKYAVKKDGEIDFTEDKKPHEKTGFPFDVTDLDGWKAALEELYSDGFDMKFVKFSLDDLTALGFKPRELHAIEMLIEDPEFESEGN